MCVAHKGMSKIQYNKDVGKSILESLAFNIVARIDDVDDLTKHSDQFSSLYRISVIVQKSLSMPHSMPFASTPYRTAFSTPNHSPSKLVTLAKGDRSPFLPSSKVPQRGMSVTKVLIDYLSIDSKPKECRNPNERTESVSSVAQETPVPFERLKEAVSLRKLEPVLEKEP